MFFVIVLNVILSVRGCKIKIDLLPAMPDSFSFIFFKDMSKFLLLHD